MRKKICLLLCIVLMGAIFSMPGSAASVEEKPLLSEMSESECLEFVKERGVVLPNLREKESDWGPFVKQIITLVEASPNVDFGISYTVTADLAEEIRSVVNAYYGINEWEQPSQLLMSALSDSATWLEHSEVYGEWDESYRYYNCYSFVLGYGVAYDPGAVAYLQEHPNDLLATGYEFNLYEYTAEQIGEIVCRDLELRLQERIVMQPSEMDISNLCTEEEIICLRIGPEDYHFMKYTSEGWLHKPSRTQVLRYKSTPTDDVVWTNERVIDGEFKPYTTTYNSTIYFISYNGHDWNMTCNSNGTHTKSCSICGDSFTYSCDYSYSYIGLDTHSGRCLVCNGTVPNGACDITVTNNGNGTHTRACSLCDNHYTVNCSLEYTNINNTRHSASCTECGYYVNSQLCTLTYTSRGNKTHTVRCTKCQNTYTGNCSITYSYLSANQHRGSCSKCSYTHTASCYYMTAYCGNSTLGDVHRTQCQTCGHISGSATTACTFAYKGVGENKHVYRCTECLYIKSGPTACMFKSDNTCKFCGARKDSAVINDLEQEETA